MRGTKVVWTVAIAITLAQLAVTCLPPLRSATGMQPVPLPDGVPIVAVGVALFAIIAVEKQLRLVFRRVEGKVHAWAVPVVPVAVCDSTRQSGHLQTFLSKGRQGNVIEDQPWPRK